MVQRWLCAVVVWYAVLSFNGQFVVLSYLSMCYRVMKGELDKDQGQRHMVCMWCKSHLVMLVLLCMCVCLCVCVCGGGEGVYVCGCICVCVSVGVYVWVCMYVCVWVCVCVCVCVCKWSIDLFSRPCKQSVDGCLFDARSSSLLKCLQTILERISVAVSPPAFGHLATDVRLQTCYDHRHN